MKKCLSIIICIIFCVVNCMVYAGTSRVRYENGKIVWEYEDLPEIVYENGYRRNYKPEYMIPDDVVFSDYTTKRYAPWWLIYSYSNPDRILAGIPAGDNGQCTYSVAYSPSNPRMMYMTTDCNGIYKSTDGGASWNICNNGLGLFGATCIKFDPDNENVAYVLATGTTSIGKAGSPGIGIWKTDDGGAFWKKLTGTGEVKAILKYYTKHAIDFGEKHNGRRDVYVCGVNGLFRSSDEGATWNCILKEEVNNVEIVGDKIFAATSQSGILMSSDSGATWTAKNNVANSSLPLKMVDISKIPNSSNEIMCCSDKMLYYSNDCGETWTVRHDLVAKRGYDNNATFQAIEFGVPDQNGHSRMYASIGSENFPLKWSDNYGADFFIMKGYNKAEILKYPNIKGYLPEAFDVHPTEPMEVYRHSFKSIDGGETYEHSSAGYSGMRLSDIWFNPNDNNDMCLGYTDVGFYRTYDFGHENDQYPPMIYSTQDDTNIKWAVVNGKWSSIGVITCHKIAVDPDDTNKVFMIIGTDPPTLKVSTDGGLNFDNVITDVGTNLLKIYKDVNHNIIYTTNYTSYNGGKDWIKNPYPIYAVSPLDNDVVYAYAKDETNNNPYIYKSTDQGRTFTKFTEKPIWLNKIEPDLTVPDRLYATAYGNGLQIVNPNGTFAVKNEADGFAKPTDGTLSVVSVAQNPRDPDHLVAGSADVLTNTISSGLFESFDRGNSWHVVPNTPGACDIWCVKFHPNLPLVYCGTSSGTLVYEYGKLFDRNYKVVNAGFYNEKNLLVDDININSNCVFKADICSDESTVTQYAIKFTYYNELNEKVKTEYHVTTVKGKGIYNLKAEPNRAYISQGYRINAEVVKYNKRALEPLINKYEFK